MTTRSRNFAQSGRVIALAISMGVFMLWSVVGAEAAVSLVPHRAVYDLEMSATRSNSNVVAARGMMEYRWSDVCDGWALSHRAQIDLAYSNGQNLDFGWKLTSWEAKDGLSYRFYIRRFNNGEETERVRGGANIDGAGRGGTARFTLPEERSLDLPPGTLFPTAHTIDVIEKFHDSQTVLWHMVFDGSGDNGLFEISSISAGELAAGEELPQNVDSELMAGLPSWTAFFAFYDPAERASQPSHEQRLRVFPNGVVSDMSLDYGDFVLSGHLRELESLPNPDCQ